MNDAMQAVTNFERELRAAGVSARAAVPTTFYYITALQHGTDHAWRAFYRSVYERLCELSDGGAHGSAPAIASLVMLLEDDLGRELLCEDELARIRGMLVELHTREAHLPS